VVDEKLLANIYSGMMPDACYPLHLVFSQLQAEAELRVLRVGQQLGQFGATCEGLRSARGQIVVVLDGDLQDPPEIIPDLVQRLDSAADTTRVVFAVKTNRDDSLPVRFGAMAYNFIIRRILGADLPQGAGSYCAMRSELSEMVAQTPNQKVNIASILASTSAGWDTVTYVKGARKHGLSKIGLFGLAQEAVGSMIAIGIRPRILVIFCSVFLLGAGYLSLFEWGERVRYLGLGATVIGCASALGAVAMMSRFNRQ